MLGRFTARFIAFVLAFSVLYQIDMEGFDGAVTWRFCDAAAQVAGAFVAVLYDGDAVVERNLIIHGDFKFEIIPECTGLEVIALFAAAVLAFPTSWVNRGRALLRGTGMLLLLNLVRIVSLVYVGARSETALEYGHYYVWPIFILTAGLGIWLFWIAEAAREPGFLD
jgi:exosortase/archaeosortase family protein